MNECLSKALFCTTLSVNNRLFEIFSSSSSSLERDEQFSNGLKTKMNQPRQSNQKTKTEKAHSQNKGNVILVDSLTEVSPDLKPSDLEKSGTNLAGEQKSNSSNNWQSTTGLASFQTPDSTGLPEVEE